MGDVIEVLDLPRIGFIGRLEFVDLGVGILDVDVDDRQPGAEAELAAGRILDQRLEDLLRGPAVRKHFFADDGHALELPSMLPV